MMRWGSRLLLILSAVALAACGSVPVVKNSRKGLFETWATYETPPSSRIARDEADEDEEDADGSPGVDPDKLVELQRFASDWRWPLREVQVTSPFGKRDRDVHEGIDLRASVGTPVYATDAGVVVYAGRRIRGYGKMVVIKHGKGLTTVYAHNSALYVKKGQRMKKGQKIALSGATGRVSGPHLHFEVRHGVTALDPKLLLGESGRAKKPPPGRRVAARSRAR